MAHGAPLKLHHGSAITGRERDLIVGYEMDAQEGVLINKEVTGLGGGSDGTIVTAKQMQDSIHGNGLRFIVDSGVVYAVITGDTTSGTFSVTVRPWQLGSAGYIFYQTIGATEYRIWFTGAGDINTRFGDGAGASASGYFGLSGKSVRLRATWGGGHFYFYVDGDLVDDYPAVFTNNMTLLRLGATSNAGANGFDGEMFDAVFESRLTTAAEAKRDYIQYARRAWYQESFRAAHVSSAGTAAGRLENTWWEVVNTGATDIRIAHDLESERIFGVRNAKYIECVADGQIWIPTQSLGLKTADPEAAYGTWEFWLKHQDGNNSFIYLIADSTATGALNGYFFRVNNVERIHLTRVNAGVGTILIQTDTDYFPTDEWTRVKIARRYDGRFTIFMNGILVAALGGWPNPTTDNTHTDSSYIILDLDDGDAVGPINHRWGEML